MEILNPPVSTQCVESSGDKGVNIRCASANRDFQTPRRQFLSRLPFSSESFPKVDPSRVPSPPPRTFLTDPPVSVHCDRDLGLSTRSKGRGRKGPTHWNPINDPETTGIEGVDVLLLTPIVNTGVVLPKLQIYSVVNVSRVSSVPCFLRNSFPTDW